MSSVLPPSWQNAPPTSRPPVSPHPPFTPDPTQRTSWETARADAKIGSNLLAAGAGLYAVTIPLGLLVFKFVAQEASGRDVAWSEIFGTLEAFGFLGIIIGGMLAQAIFGTLAGIGAVLLRVRRPQVAIPMIVVGVVAVIFSFAIFGGIVGAIGGFLTIAGGAKGRTKPRPPMWTVPPPYYGPPPYPP